MGTNRIFLNGEHSTKVPLPLYPYLTPPGYMKGHLIEYLRAENPETMITFYKHLDRFLILPSVHIKRAHWWWHGFEAVLKIAYAFNNTLKLQTFVTMVNQA